ncbi:alpha-1-acid glycoprotein-like isoform X2 [Microtus pennsylvanicus]|uniref:alpha-1-acid glycoprotein-like isoform X2 n=1 Tax=Microtus pennsylvanicus TaxID=10058 RepID=UPI003F6AE349
MVLHVVLVILSLLPLLEAQNPEPANITGTAITNDTLIWLSGKWFYIGAALRNPSFKQEAQKIQAEYFCFTPNLTDDTLLLQEYQTTEDRCVFNSSKLEVQRENGGSRRTCCPPESVHETQGLHACVCPGRQEKLGTVLICEQAGYCPRAS